jgi:hypothetical protein
MHTCSCEGAAFEPEASAAQQAAPSHQAAAAVTGSERCLPLIALSRRHIVLLVLLTPTPPSIAAIHLQENVHAALMQHLSPLCHQNTAVVTCHTPGTPHAALHASCPITIQLHNTAACNSKHAGNIMQHLLLLMSCLSQMHDTPHHAAELTQLAH